MPGVMLFENETAEQHAVITIKCFVGRWTLAAMKQLAVDVVLNQRQIVAREQRQHSALGEFRRARTKRIVEAANHQTRTHRMLFDRTFQVLQAEAIAWMGWDLQHFQPESFDALQNAVINRRLDRDGVA